MNKTLTVTLPTLYRCRTCYFPNFSGSRTRVFNHALFLDKASTSETCNLTPKGYFHYRIISTFYFRTTNSSSLQHNAKSNSERKICLSLNDVSKKLFKTRFSDNVMKNKWNGKQNFCLLFQ